MSDIGKLLHKQTYKSGDDKLGKFKAYLDDAVKYGEGLKLLHKGIKCLSKTEKSNNTVYHTIGRQFGTAHDKWFSEKNVEVLKTYNTILMDMSETFTSIGNDHFKTMKMVNTNICDIFDEATMSATQLKTNATIIKKSEQDLEWKKKLVIKAIENGEKAKKNLASDTAQQKTGFLKNITGQNNKTYNAEDEARHISDLQLSEAEAERRLKEDVERVKTELFQFDIESAKLSNTLVLLVNALEVFHKQALSELEQLKPRIEYNGRLYAQRFYLHRIGDNNQEDKRQVARPVEILIEKLLQQNCFDEEGLFRLPGATTKIKIICAALDSPNYTGDIAEDFEPDNQALASALKKFFRDLEIPVLSKLKEGGEIDEVEKLVSEDDIGKRLDLIKEAIHKLSTCEKYNLAYLCRFCQIIKENQTVNMMSSNALAICWAPTLIGTASTQGQGTFFVQEMIEYAHIIFTDEKYSQLDFKFKQRSTDLVNKIKSQNHHPDAIYGFTGQHTKYAANDVQALKPEASSVLDKTVRKPKNNPVEILKHTTPNLSRAHAKRPNRPMGEPMRSNSKTSQRLGTPSSNPDYTGFAHLLNSTNSDEEDGLKSSDNVSLTEQLSDMWLSKERELQKDSRPNKKPPKPPAPNNEATSSNHRPNPQPKPRKSSSIKSDISELEFTPM